MKNLYDGLKILLKYNELADAIATNDIIYCDGPSETEINATDAAALRELGFYWSETCKCWEYIR